MSRIAAYKGFRIEVTPYELADVQAWMADFTLSRISGSETMDTVYHLDKIAFPDEESAVREELDAARREIDKSN